MALKINYPSGPYTPKEGGRKGTEGSPPPKPHPLPKVK